MERRALSALKSNGNDLRKPMHAGNKKLGATNGAGALIILLPFGSDFSLLEFSGLHRAFRRPAKLGQVQREREGFRRPGQLGQVQHERG